MLLRDVLVDSFPFAALNFSLSAEEIERRTRDLTDDFLLHCPSAGRLTASILKSAQLPTANGMDLQFWLAETDQMSLMLEPTSFSSRGAVASSDCFANDVMSVKTDLSNARSQLHRAMSPTRTVEELRDNSDLGFRLRSLRERVRGRRPFYIPGNPFQPTLIEANSPRLLPHGIRARMRAKVISLSKGLAVLQGITLIDHICTDLVGVAFPKSMEMQRPTYQVDQKTGISLLAALDTGSSITVDVSVCLDWASAQPVSLVLRGIEPQTGA
jgi:hypothetical protein